MDLVARLRLEYDQFSAGLAASKGLASKFFGEINTESEKSSKKIADDFKKGGDTATGSIMQLRNTLVGAAIAVDLVAAAFDKMALGMVSAFTKQEAAFAGIRKTINATEDEFQKIKGALTDLSNRIPVKFEDLAKISEIAGQLGVRGTANIVKFTDTIARISVSTNLTAERAAKDFARLSNVMGEPISNIDKIASAVVALGNGFQELGGAQLATTEAEIVTFATRIAGAGKIAGLATSDILGIGAAFTSVGVQAEAGGTAVQKMLISMTEAVATSSSDLRLFAILAGETEEAFTALFKTEPAVAFTKVIEGLGRAGDKAFMFLEGITGNNARVIRAMLSTANAGDLLAKSMAYAGLKIKDTDALMNESNQRFSTFENTMKTLNQAFTNFSAALGEQLMPILRPFAAALWAVIVGFQQMPTFMKALIAITIGAAAVFASLLATFVSLAALVSMAMAAFSAAAGPLAAFGIVTLGGLLAKLALVTAALVAIGLAVWGVVKYFGLFEGPAAASAASMQKIAGTAEQAGTNLQQAGAAASESVADWTRLDKSVGDTTLSFRMLWTRLVELSAGPPGLPGFFESTMIYLRTLKDAADWTANGISRFFQSLIPPTGPLDAALDRMDKKMQKAADDLAAKRDQFVNAGRAMAAEAIAEQNRVLQAKDTFPGLAFPTTIGLEEYEKRLRAIELASKAATDKMELFTASLKLQRQAELPLLATEEELFQARRVGLEDQLKALFALGQQQQALFGQEMAQAEMLVADKGKREKAIDDLTKKQREATTERMKSFAGLQEGLLKVDHDERELAEKRFRQQIVDDRLYADRVIATMELVAHEHLRLQGELRQFGMTEFQQFVAQEKARTNAWTSEMEERILASGGTAAQVLALFNAAEEVLAAKITEKLTAGAAAGDKAVKGLTASLGLSGEAAHLAEQAWSLEGKAYDTLSPKEQASVKTRAAALTQLDAQAILTKDLIAIRELEMAGLTTLDATYLAVFSNAIDRQEALQAAHIKRLESDVNAEQVAQQQSARIDELTAQRHGRVLDFLTAKTRGWVLQQDTLWQSLGKAIVGVFDSVQRTVSDIFFTWFTTGTFKLADAWKSMLNSMLRTLSDFLASQAMQVFLSFLFGGATKGLATSAGSFGASLVGGAGSSGLLGGAVTAVGKALGFTMSATSPSTPSTLTIPSASTSEFPSVGADVPSVYYADVPSVDYGAYSSDYSDLAFASGGRVPGSGRGDIVPAMLEPGEFVIRRSVASALGPALDALNAYGRPSSSAGRLFMQSGGLVSSAGAPEPSIADLQSVGALQAIGYLLQQQLALQQQMAENTGLTATALTGAEAPAPTAGFTSIVGSGGAARAVTVGGTSPSFSSGGGGESPTFGVAATVGGSGASSLSTASATSLVSGGMNLAFGASAGDPLQMLGGSLSLLGGIAGFSGSQSALDSLFGSSSGGRMTSSAIGAAGSALGLYAGISSILKQGITAGNISGSILSAYNLYSSVSSLTNGALPSFSSLVANSISSLSPGFAEYLYGSASGLAATEAGIGLGAGEIAAGALAGFGAYIPVVGMIIQAVTSYFGNKDMMDFLKGGFVNNPIKGALYSNATLGVENANSILDQLHALGIQQGTLPDLQSGINVTGGGSGVSTDDLKGALSSISQNLLPYYETAQGGVGAIKASDTIAGGYGDMGAYVANFTRAQAGMVEVVHELLARGVSYEDIGKLKGGNWLQPMLAIGNPLSEYYAGDAAKFDTEAYELISKLGEQIEYTQAGDPLGVGIPTGLRYFTMANGDLVPIQPGMLTPQFLLRTIGSHGHETTGVERMYGGSIWAALARMGGAISPDIRALIQAHFDPWAEARTMTPEQLGSFVAGPLLQAYMTPLLDAGGGPGGSSSGPAGAGPAAAGDSGDGGDGGGMQTGGWTIPGTGVGDHMWTRLEPGEYVVPRPQAKMYATQLQNLGSGTGGEAGPQAIHYNVSITVNGSVDDPEELARILAPRLRDELKRIDPRFSRAGNKAQV